jgi:hypothetical protein
MSRGRAVLEVMRAMLSAATPVKHGDAALNHSP